MLAKTEKTYHDNFITGVKALMVDLGADSIKDLESVLEINYMALYKIMDKSNKPTADHGIKLCFVAGFSANWMFLNKGMMRMEEQATLNKILREVKLINDASNKNLKQKV